MRRWATIVMAIGALATSLPTARLSAQQGGAGALIQDPFVYDPTTNPLFIVCSQGVNTTNGGFLLGSLPSSVSVGPCAYAGGIGRAAASWSFGSVIASASMIGGYAGDGLATENAFAGGGGLFEDLLSFGSGVVPTDVVFYYALGFSSEVTPGGAGGVLEFGAKLSAGFQDHFISNVGIGSASFQTSGNTFSFLGFSGLTVTTSWFDPADFAVRASSSFRVTGIQFFANGVDVTSQVTPTFASGHNYHIGAPQQITAVPEPGSIVLLASGLLVVGAVTWRSRQRQG
jgi:hypothetical protein